MVGSHHRGRNPSRHGVSRLAAGVLALVWLLLAAPRLATAAAEAPAFATEFVRLATTDGRETAGLLRRPPARAPRGGIVLVHGYGGNFYSGVQAHLAGALAARGFATLAVNTRDHDRGPKTTLFEDNRWDVEAALSHLARLGVGPLALLAHSLGTNTALHYAAATRDGRVRALVLLAGPGNAFEWNVRQFGRERATQVLEEALRLQAAGRGRELMVVDLGPLGKALYSADHLVSLRGPETPSDPFRNIAELKLPVLLVYATADRLVELDVGRRLRAAATRAARVDLVELAGADHAFTRHEAELTTTVERWLGEVLGR